MFNVTALQTEFKRTLDQFGMPVRIRFFTSSIGSVYDDDRTLTASGTDIWTSGIVQNLGANSNTYEGRMIEQGRFNITDSKAYVANDVPTSGTFKFGVGSPVNQEFALADGGMIFEPPNSSVIVYKKLFLKSLPTGSLPGE